MLGMEVFKPTPAWSQGENFHNLPPVLFVSTTNLSEFAASLNRIGVSYKTSCSVALALRYIPEIQLQREYHDIAQSQQARGIGMGKKASLVRRLKAASSILMPLILSGMDRIEVISNAMELRGFGKNKKRMLYMALCAALLVGAIAGVAVMDSSFYNPFR